MSWAACDRLARIARRLDLKERALNWTGAATRLRDQILARAWRPRAGTLSAILDGDRLDATLLLLPELGFLPHGDPRMQATVDTAGRELRRGSYLMRYTDGDDFGAPQNAFLVASFWYVNALADTGRIELAKPSRSCCAGARRSACCPSTSIRRRASCGATSRRPSAWSGSCPARAA
jgi:GH15 family glucan-1,4-alpha-glucosidase